MSTSRADTLVRRLLPLAVAGLVVAQAAFAAGNGRKGAKREYRANAAGIAFSAELEPILFQLQTVDSRYRVIRIRIVNQGGANLALSRQGDAVSAIVDEREVAGILDLGVRDAAVWDRFDSNLRSYLAYPARVGQKEEESIFVFLPADQVKTAPIALQYRIASLKDTVVLRAPVAAAD